MPTFISSKLLFWLTVAPESGVGAKSRRKPFPAVLAEPVANQGRGQVAQEGLISLPASPDFQATSPTLGLAVHCHATAWEPQISLFQAAILYYSLSKRPWASYSSSHLLPTSSSAWKKNKKPQFAWAKQPRGQAPSFCLCWGKLGGASIRWALEAQEVFADTQTCDI